MKYMILMYGSQQDYDAMAGKATDKPAWSAEDVAAMGAFMESFTKDLVESGELVDTRGLAAPVHTRRIQLQSGVPVVIFNEGYASTSGPSLQRTELSAEAIRLARMVHRQLPGDGEVTGLLALMLLTGARRPARTGRMAS